jgi:GGDEF domain-containing protein
MVHLNFDPHELIENKIRMINEELSDNSDGIPNITLSAGISFDFHGIEPDELFRRADAALYHVKENGRKGCCFYSDELSSLADSSKTRISAVDAVGG